ncbi:MAG: SUMF1/EgtB/PvdO family nonheme iron enzyme, partial [Candidatus Promineifilaceae bacterium]
LCRQIDEALHLATAAATRPFEAYYQESIRELSSDRYQLDSRFVQLTLLVDQGPEAQGVRFVHDRRRTFNSLKQLLTEVEDRALVLLGGPGSGKTTLLRRLQLELAWEGLAVTETPIPFFVPLNAYFQRDGTPADPQTWLASLWQQRPGLPNFARLLGDGRFLFLLDGLNELPHESQHDYQTRIRGWQQFLQQAIPLGNTAVFSCRSLDYSVPLSSDAVTVRQVDVGALSPTQIEQFLTLYLADQAPPVWDALRQDNQQLTLFAVPFFLRLLVDQVIATGEMLTSRVALLTGFVRRALFREIGQRHHHLFASGWLLTANDVQQVIHDRWPTAVALPSQGPLIPKLESLAFAMQDGRLDQAARQVRVAEETALALLDHPHAAAMIAAGVQLNVLDKNLTHLEITYLHQLIQEYFAARILAQKPEPTRLTVPWHAGEVTPKLAGVLASLAVSDPLPSLPATGCEETARLAAAMMPASEAARFVTALMDANLPLAARCAALPEVMLPPAQIAALQEALLARIGDPQADLRARIAAAEALAELGDARFEQHHGPHGAYLLPPFITIEGGAYPIGADDSQYADEKPAHRVEIAPFELAVFPVTNAEYALFMAAGGYADEQWWLTKVAQAWLRGESGSEGQLATLIDSAKQLQEYSDEAIKSTPTLTPEQVEAYLWLKHASPEEIKTQGEEWYPPGKRSIQPEYWEDGRFNHPSQPVVGISWFEAKAYCAWL